jgi:flagellar FliL protein
MTISKSTETFPRSTPPAKQGGGTRFKRVLAGSLMLLATAGASGAATWAITAHLHQRSAAQAQSAAQATGAPVIANAAAQRDLPPIFAAIKPFTVTLKDGQAERLLHVAITVQLGNEASRTRIEKYMPEVRNRVLMVLSTQAPHEVQTHTGKVELAKVLTESLRKPFVAGSESPSILGVLFTEFVVQ